ncbi:MAG: 5'-nucleotidase C-terminal domain-containing protein [Elainellaceae cyanobacterium]
MWVSRIRTFLMPVAAILSAISLSRSFRRLGFLILIIGTFLLALSRPGLVQESDFTLRILHTNDHHAHLEPVEVGDVTLGGIARRETLIEQIRNQSQVNQEPVLLLDAGDIFQGTLYFNQYLGQLDRLFYNSLRYDAATIGNHEFDRGQQVLSDFIGTLTFPMISANIEVAPTSPLAAKIKPWQILTVNNEPIGILGLTTPETAILSNPGEGVTFTDPIAAAQQAVTELSAEGVNKIIALTHLGLATDLALAQQVDGIDLIVGGHSHTPLGEMPGATQPYPIVEATPNGAPVLVVTDWEWGKYLGDIRLDFDATGVLQSWDGTPHVVEASILPDLVLALRLQEFAEPIQALQAQVIGQAPVFLDGERVTVRSGETNLGNLIADAMLDKTRPDGGQVVIINGGGIRASIPAGEVTVGEVLTVLPFENTIARADLTGAQIIDALENGVSQVEEEAGRFPQVAGLRFVWNPEAPAGQRIVDVQLRTEDGTYAPLDPTATYRVVTNSFLLTGGDGYSVFEQAQERLDTGFLQSDVVIDYITSRSPINIQTENRIVRGTEPLSMQ